MTIMGCVGTHVYNMSFLYVGKEIDAKINIDEIIDLFDRLGHRSTFKLAKMYLSFILPPFQIIRCFRFVKQMYLDTF
jgi:hypothetical protein